MAAGSGRILSSRLTSLLVGIALAFEPISPPFISLWLQRRLSNWKKRGIVDEYKVNTTRIGKFHYRVEVNLDVNERQTEWILANIRERLGNRRGR